MAVSDQFVKVAVSDRPEPRESGGLVRPVDANGNEPLAAETHRAQNGRARCIALAASADCHSLAMPLAVAASSGATDSTLSLAVIQKVLPAGGNDADVDAVGCDED